MVLKSFVNPWKYPYERRLFCYSCRLQACSLSCETAFLDIIIKFIEISPQEFWKNLEHKYQCTFSKALSEYLTSHAFSKVLLQILDMFLLNRALFQVKNLSWGLIERLFTELLVLNHNFQATRYAFVLTTAVHVLPHF